MSDKIPTTSRLDSLSRRATPSATAAKPGLKFKPKVVARRTKEERAADAPLVAPEHQAPKRGGMGARGGRGGIRGSRGGRGMAGTHVVQAGPLASGNAIHDTRQNMMSRSGTSSPRSDFLSTLKKKEPSGSRATSVGLESDDENDLGKINMNEEYKFTTEETELFPVRASRSKPEEEVKKEIIDLSEDSATDTREGTPDVVMVDADPSVKPEPIESTLAAVLSEKDAILQQRLNDLQIKSDSLTLGTEEAMESTQRLNDDHRGIVECIQRLNNQPERLMLFQMPKVLPTFDHHSDKQNAVKDEKDVSMVDIEKATGLEGEFAKLRIHKSGKLTMKVGNVVMDVSRGASAELLQEVVLMHKAGDNAASYLLGHLEDKIVVTPNFS